MLRLLRPENSQVLVLGLVPAGLRAGQEQRKQTLKQEMIEETLSSELLETNCVRQVVWVQAAN